MHPNPIFRKSDTQTALDAARLRGFGTLALSADPVPLFAHIPFLLDAGGGFADLHMVRSNPIVAASGDGHPAALVVRGPDGYVSPDWYEVDDQVPTWNYVAVQITGHLRPLPQTELEPLLTRQSAHFEGLLPKAPWTMNKMSADAKARMMRMILPFRFEVDDVQSTFKLGQNKPDAVRLCASERIGEGVGQDLEALSELMRAPPA